QDGNFLEEWKQFGGPSGLFIDAEDTVYAADARLGPPKHGEEFQYGIRIGSIKDGVVKIFIPSREPEGVVADSMGNIYVGEESATGSTGEESTNTPTTRRT